MRKVEYLQLPNGHEPVRDWLMELDELTRNRIRAHIYRVAAGGGKKNIRALGDSIFEIKMKFGSGYRVYFAEQGKSIVLLLLGGDKGTQERDIEKAKTYWREYVSKNYF